MKTTTVSIPASLSHLKKDRRGFPIFHTVTIMRDGTPDFRVIDIEKARDAARRKLCGLSGHRLDKRKGVIFVGGPVSAFSGNGLYVDPPMLESAAFYALQVCPYLSAPRFSEKEFKEKGPGIPGTISMDPHVLAGRPPVFVAVRSRRWQLLNEGHQTYFKPEHPHMEVSFWTHGGMLSLDQARSIDPELPTREQLAAQGTSVREPDALTPDRA